MWRGVILRPMQIRQDDKEGDSEMGRYMLKIGIGLLLTAFVCGCKPSSSKTAPQKQLRSGIVVGTVEQTSAGPPINGNKTMFLVTDKGTNDGVSVGTEGYVRIHKAALLDFRVYDVSDELSNAQGWYYDTVKPGAQIIFNIGGLSDDELFKVSDDLSK